MDESLFMYRVCGSELCVARAMRGEEESAVLVQRVTRATSSTISVELRVPEPQ